MEGTEGVWYAGMRRDSVTVIFKVGEKGKLYRDSESEGR